MLQIKPLPDPTINAIYTGRILGQGSFCVVKEIIQCEPSAQGACLALKKTRSDLGPEQRVHAEASIRNEIIILSTLDHPAIVRMM